MNDRVQLIVVVETVDESEIGTTADHNVKPGLGEAVMLWLHPAGVGVNDEDAHVYVDVPTGAAGVDSAH
jgi:hypothetical protein